MIIYAGTSGALDDIPANKVSDFERQFLDYMHDTHPDVPQQIRDAKKDIPAEVKTILDEAAATVKAQLA
jgi:F-type H+-transporting ATPase subunit alpha